MRFLNRSHVVFRRSFLAALLVVPALGLWALGRADITPPEVVLDLSETTYISPGNSDGVQDAANWNVTITPSERMVVKGYRILVTDETGTEIYRFEDFSPDRQPIIFRFKRPVTLPDSMSWNGETTDGAEVAEGSYRLVVEGVDDRDRVGASQPYTIVVDNTAPSATVALPYSVFSPNADGNQDILVLEQSGTVESSWTGEFLDENGDAVFVAEISGAAPENLVWDGNMTSGSAAPDGTYGYRLSSTDLAGNSFSTSVARIVVDTRDTPIALTRDVGSFSPNGDGSTDSIEYTFSVPVTEGISQWSLSVVSGRGTVVRTETGQDIPDTFLFDGTDDNGSVLPEGSYTGRLAVLYTNGNNPVAEAAPVTLDVTPPSVSLVAEYTTFSPNGDGSLDSIGFFQETSGEDVWSGTVLSADGDVVRSFEWRTRPEWNLFWNGTDADGLVVPDGEYRYVLASRDKAGNYAEAVVAPITVDTRETPVSLSASGGSFSPNADGVRDTLTFFTDIQDPRGVTRLVLRITTEADAVVRQFERNSSVGEITWAGRNAANQAVPDGAYFAELTVEYENGNKPTSRFGPVAVDRARPSAQVRSQARVFSPDGDGSLDTIEISQSASTVEETWIGSFTDANGRLVREIRWSGSPESFVWDGTDSDGNRLDDGVYVYTLSATDKAGNSASIELDGLTIDTRPTPVAVRIGSSAFSPNGDNSRDDMVISPVLEVRDNVESWRLRVLDSQSAPRFEITGGSPVPESISFDGTDGSGRRLPEGLYTAELSVLYINGNQPAESSPAFALDVTEPSATAAVEQGLFSPNGDGLRDAVEIDQTGTNEDAWTGRVTAADGRTIREFAWTGTPPPIAEWDGRDNDGRLVPDGEYSYSLSTTDKAGNSGGSQAIGLSVDNRSTTAALSANWSAFSPNGDGVRDSVTMTPTVALNDGIRSYTVEVLAGDDGVVRTFSGAGSPPAQIVWRGVNDRGQVVADGAYRGRLTVEYRKGDRPIATTGEMTVDTQTPEATASLSGRIFSPEGDGRVDTITVQQTTSSEELWEGTVTDASGRAVRSSFWNGRAGDFLWDGRDDDGSTVPDGVYRYTLSATDPAGNSVARSITGIQVDTRVTSAFINPTARAISPDGDGDRDSVRINLYPSLTDGISDWSLEIVGSTGRPVRDLTSGSPRTVPASVLWNGRTDGGIVVDGEYTVRLTVQYDKGNLVEAESTTPILVDTSGPRFSVSTSPTPFSPDQDGQDDLATISIRSVRDASVIATWRAEILDRFGKVFYERSGSGTPPSSFQWNGLAASGELVQAAEDYVVSVTLVDGLGNVGTEEAILPVDVLVLRDGNNLKIRISSIQFAPNSAELEAGLDPEIAERNRNTLRRLSEILGRYPTYQIRIEGHAVSVYWENAARAEREEREELQPLSKARADSVKSALVSLGIPGSRMTTDGIGGQQPVVPHGDLDNRWKNRRVEFLLIR